MAFDPDKHDLAINAQGYRVSSFGRASAPDFVARFNTGDQGENDLNLLKSKSTKSFFGGMFQNKWEDDEMLDSIKGGSIFSENGYLYPNVAGESMSIASGSGSHSVMASAVYDGYLFIAVYDGGENEIYRIHPTTHAATKLTLPAALVSANPITDLTATSRHLHVCTGTDTGAVTVYRTVFPYDGTFETVGTKEMDMLVAAGKGMFMGVADGAVWQYQGGGTWASIEKYPSIQMEEVNSAAALHGRVYFGTKEGLYSYDGARLQMAIDYKHSYDDDNFAHMVEWRGWLYFTIGDTIWRFNEATVEKLIDTEEVVNIDGLQVNDEALWFFTETGWGGHGGEKTASSDSFQVWKYDGVGTTQFCEQGSPGHTFYTHSFAVNGDSIYVFVAYFTTPTGGVDGTAYNQRTGIQSNNTSGETPLPLFVQTSEFDAGFPNVDKQLHSVEIDELNEANYDIAGTVEVLVKDESGEWHTRSLGTITSVDDLVLEVGENAANYLGKAFKIRFETSSGDYVVLQHISFRYSLHPRRRWRWQIALILAGKDDPEPIQWLDGSAVIETSAALRANILEAQDSAAPINFVFNEPLTLSSSLTDSYTGSVTLNESAFVLAGSAGFAYIDDEIVRYKNATGQTIEITERGALGTVAASHVADAKVFRCYRVYVSRVISERFNLQESSDSYGNRRSELVAEVTEV